MEIAPKQHVQWNWARCTNCIVIVHIWRKDTSWLQLISN